MAHLVQFPPELTPDLVLQIAEENAQRSRRPRRSNQSSTASLNPSPRKKRQRKASYEDDEHDDYNDDDDDEHQPLRKRIRRVGEHVPPPSANDPMSVFQKKTRDRLANKVLDIDANPQENASFKRFVKLLDEFHDDYERHYEQLEETPDEQLDLILSDHTLEEMASLSEKLKLSTYMSQADMSKLKRLLEILALRIKQGIELSPILKHDVNEESKPDEREERVWRNLVFERLAMSANACEIGLNIMTTPNMPKEILAENVIEYAALFVKAQLAKTIFPEYDPLYRSDNQAKGKSICASTTRHVGWFSVDQIRW